MNLDDLLKQHQDALDKAKASMAARVVTPADLKRLPAINTQRIATVTARIDDIGKQKAAAILRFDAAIAEHQTELKRLQEAAVRDGALADAVQKPQDAAIKDAQQVRDQILKAKPADRPANKPTPPG
jgi:hypothetical protein